MARRTALCRHITSLLAAMTCIVSSACLDSKRYEPPGRFIVDSVRAEVRVGVDPFYGPGSTCRGYVWYRYEVLGGVIDEFCLSCITPTQGLDGMCVFSDYFLPCYIPPGFARVDSLDFHTDDTFEGIDTTDVIIEIHGVMPDERWHYCSGQYFEYADTVRAPVKRGSLNCYPPRNDEHRSGWMRLNPH